MVAKKGKYGKMVLLSGEGERKREKGGERGFKKRWYGKESEVMKK